VSIDNFESVMGRYIIEYSRLYPGRVLNNYTDLDNLDIIDLDNEDSMESNRTVNQDCQTDITYDSLIKKRSLRCRKDPKDKKLVQKEYRERNREKLNEISKLYYKRKKELVNEKN
jgi:hypothetical protein